jgi:NitT/TauT family transport system substrate-binding protein
MLKRCFLAVVLAFAVTSPQMVRPQELPTIHIASVTNDTCSAILYAMKLGLFQKAGLNIDFQGMSSGAAASAAVAGGAAQFGQSSLVTLIDAHARGIPFTLIAPSGIITRGSMYAAALVRSDSPIKTGADLNGKTFGVYGIGDIYTISARTWMEKNGGDPASLKFVELPISAMVEAIATGRVDAGSMNEPAVEVALINPRLRLLTHPLMAIAPRWLYTAWFAATEYAAAHRPVMDAFAKATRDAAAYCNSHHDQTVDLIANFTSVDAGTVRKMTRVEQGITLDPKLVQPVIDEMAKSKGIDKAFDARDLFLH